MWALSADRLQDERPRRYTAKWRTGGKVNGAKIYTYTHTHTHTYTYISVYIYVIYL